MRVRTGAVAVEMAVVLPVIVLLLLGSLELGRSVMVRHVLEEASRAGCRVAIMENSTTKDVEAIVDTAMAAACISGYTVTVNPDPSVGLGPFEPVTVTVSVPYSQVSWVHAGFMEGKMLEGVCIMPAEAEGEDLPDPTSGKKNKKNKKTSTKKSDTGTKKSATGTKKSATGTKKS